MPDLHLYHLPGLRSSILYWLLKELEVPFTVHTFKDRTELKSLENRKRNPLGKLPSFTDEFGTFYETGAILQWILKQYSNGRLQPPASDLASQQKMLQWCWFAEASIGAYNSIQNQHTRILPEDKRVEEVLPVVRGKVADGLSVLETTLAAQNSDFILGAELTAADFMIAHAVKDAQRNGVLDGFPLLSAYIARLMSRPAFTEAYGLPL